MIASSYKKHTTLSVLFLLLLAMAGIAWSIVPLKQVVYEKMRGIQEFYVRKENREKQVARLPELKAQYDVILQNEKLLDILIMENGVVDFVKTLEGLANETHVEMSITSKDNGQIIESQPVSGNPQVSPGNGPGAKISPGILGDLPFQRYLYLNIKVRGQYEDIVVFLHKMETLPIGLDVIKVGMKKGEAEETSIVLGGGINPFLAPSGDIQTGVPQPPAANKDVFEAVFDVLVYVDKKN